MFPRKHLIWFVRIILSLNTICSISEGWFSSSSHLVPAGVSSSCVAVCKSRGSLCRPRSCSLKMLRRGFMGTSPAAGARFGFPAVEGTLPHTRHCQEPLHLYTPPHLPSPIKAFAVKDHQTPSHMKKLSSPSKATSNIRGITRFTNKVHD